MARILRLERDEFADWILTAKNDRLRDWVRISNLQSLEVMPNQVLCVWDDDETPQVGGIPPLLVVPTGSVADYIAWSATYLRALRPATAFHRILTPPQLREICKHDTEDLQKPPLALLCAIVLTEGAMQSGGAIDRFHGSVNAYTRTLSFTIARAILNIDLQSIGAVRAIESVLESWDSARRLVGSTSHPLATSEVAKIWTNVLVGLSYSTVVSDTQIDNNAFTVIREYLRDGRSPSLERIIEEILGPGGVTDAILKSPMEQRVEIVRRQIESLQAGRVRDSRVPMLIGYLVNLVYPGSMLHLSLFKELDPELVSSIVWYGVFTGLSRPTRFLEAGEGIGWALVRELSRRPRILDRPLADISLNELEILVGDGEVPLRGIKMSFPGIVKVEILPLVDATFRWGERNEPPSSTRVEEVQLDLFGRGIRHEQTAGVLEQVRVAEMAVQRLAELLRQDYSTDQKRGWKPKGKRPT